jgi:hypothetical protein
VPSSALEPDCLLGCSATVLTVSRFRRYLDADDAEPLEPISEPVEDWELGRLGKTGRRLDADEATNFLGVGDFFLSAFGGISRPVVAVLPDDGSVSLASSSAESCGETKRAVGLGPDVNGRLGFLRIG